MGTRTRLCVFTPHLYSGGIEERMARIVGGLDRQDFELSWMAFGPTNPALLERAGRSIDVLSFEKNPNRIGLDFPLIASVAEALRSLRPDLVHVHNWSVSLYGIVAARLAGVPKVLYESGGRESPEGPSRRQRALMRAMGPLVDRFTTVCDFLSDEMAEHWAVPRSKVTTMPTGVDLAKSAQASRAEQRARFGVPEGAIAIGSLGLIRPVKRIEDLLEAGAELARSDPRIVLLVIGNAFRSDPELLRARANELGIGDRLIMPGRVEDSAHAVHAIDIFVSASIFEGASNAIIEAMAAGIPVVATAVGGSPELVRDGETGLLVPPRDPGAIAAALRTLVVDPDLRARFGERAKYFARRNHDQAGMVTGYVDLYRELASEPVVSPARRGLDTARGVLGGIAAWAR